MTMAHTDLEVVYEHLAAAIDSAGEEKSEVFLAKVVLLLAERLGDRDAVRAVIDSALRDL